MKNKEEKVFSLEDEKIIEKLVNDWNGAFSNYYEYRGRVDLILEALKRRPEMVMFVPESLRKKKSFYDQVKKILPEENLRYAYRDIEEPTTGNTIKSVGQKIANKYQEIDDFYMGRYVDNEDIWIERTIGLAFTPLPYIHLVTKGVVGIGKGVVTLSKFAYDKYKQAQLQKMIEDGEDTDSLLKTK